MDEALRAITEPLSAALKARGYRKQKLTWYRRFEDTTVVFAVQKSQFSADVWYYHYGVGINAFYDTEIRSLSRCDVVYRLNQTLNGVRVTPEHLLRVLALWETDYGKDLHPLRRKAIEGKLPKMTTQRVLRYLTSGRAWLADAQSR